jgi:hypothetical protein
MTEKDADGKKTVVPTIGKSRKENGVKRARAGRPRTNCMRRRHQDWFALTRRMQRHLALACETHDGKKTRTEEDRSTNDPKSRKENYPKRMTARKKRANRN